MDSGTLAPPSAVPADRTSASDIEVWILVPFVETSDPNLQYYNDYSQSHAEYARVFASLSVPWHWQPVQLADYRAVIDGITASRGSALPVMLNLCDGDESNGVPGISVVRYLEESGLCYTGADPNFFDLTTSKIVMKHCFDAATVPTAPWAIVDSEESTEFAFARCGTPMIVKPAVSAGSMGITVRSVVHTVAELREQLELLRAGYRGWDLASGGVLVERFVAGREFTTFVVGSADAPTSCVMYPSVERIFDSSLPPTEQLLSFDRLWEIYERESPLPNNQCLWQYGPVPTTLAERLGSISWAAFASVGGRGYGRVDLRMDADTGEVFVLEVNAQCGLSEDEDYTSIGAILRFAETPFQDAILAIIGDARRRHELVITRANNDPS